MSLGDFITDTSNRFQVHPDTNARLYRKVQGQSSRLCFMGHLLMENGNALIVDAALTEARGTAERDAAAASRPGGADRAGRRAE